MITKEIIMKGNRVEDYYLQVIVANLISILSEPQEEPLVCRSCYFREEKVVKVRLHTCILSPKMKNENDCNLSWEERKRKLKG